MIARLQTTLSAMLLLAIGLPGTLGVALHGLAPQRHDAISVESAHVCSCCCDRQPADQPAIASDTDCLICKYLAATKQTPETAALVAWCDLAVAELATLEINSHPFSYPLPISARGPPTLIG